jgi:hypothetical protein
MTPVGRICRMAGLSTRQYDEEFADREALLLIAVYDGIHHQALRAVRTSLAGQRHAGLGARIAAALRAYVYSTAADLRVGRVPTSRSSGSARPPRCTGCAGAGNGSR